MRFLLIMLLAGFVSSSLALADESDMNCSDENGTLRIIGVAGANLKNGAIYNISRPHLREGFETTLFVEQVATFISAAHGQVGNGSVKYKVYDIRFNGGAGTMDAAMVICRDYTH